MVDSRQRTILADFLKIHRARLSPSDVGLPIGERRRTPGLRREEVAQLADIGTTWYTWIEQGRDISVSEKVLWRIADALRLTADERKHLFMLMSEQLGSVPASLPSTLIDPVLQHVLDNQKPNPAYITGRRCNIMAWNQAAVDVFINFEAIEAEERNLLWLLFTNASFRKLFVDWEKLAKDLTAIFRTYSAQYVNDSWYTDFVNTLQQVSPEFEQWWQRHEVCSQFDQHRALIHPIVGRLSFEVTTLHVNGDDKQRLCIYTALPGSESADKLQNLIQQSYP